MSDIHTNKIKEGKQYEQIIKRFLLLLGLLFLSPIMLNIALKAIKIYTQGKEQILSYTLLIIAIFLIIFTVFFGFKTFLRLRTLIFNND